MMVMAGKSALPCFLSESVRLCQAV